MSRFVRASKYRHVFGQPAKKEHGIENVKVTNSAWDTNVVAASGEYLSINWNASGGGAFAIIPLPSPLPLARSHTAPVLDTDWSPHNDRIVASGGEDGKVMIWKVEPSIFEGWGAEGWVPQDLDPVLRIDACSSTPTAQNVVASASGEHTWALADAIQSFTFNPTGTLVATTCRDRKLRLFDPRAGGEAVRITDGHGGIKGARVVWMGDNDRIATTGFSKMSDRQVGVWETGGLGNVKTIVIDQSSGVLMPFWSDNNILFLAGKGDGNIRYYEYESDALYALSEHKSSDPQRGMCFLPRRALNVAECEIARAYKVAGSSIEPIAFIVPRKADSFQSDIFPPAPSSEAALSAAEFFAGKPVKLQLVNLDSGVTFSSSATATAAPTPAAPAPAPTPVAANPQVSVDPSPPQAAPPAAASQNDSALAEENARLTSELRQAREQIRNLELQVEAVRANARKAAQALLDG
ncbi:microtubule binding protein [Roridomyces roridus]|uniref:Coronin n=1 Tax=Roridomyces roridus TaxID=1738132 RepID=A0AAD7BMV7_9AGAR|nr:microtubule binding protein [Roridomyces roridus]